jgi:hypothetical protein
MSFPTIDWAPRRDERCVQLRDTLDGVSLESGGFSYEVSIRSQGEPDKSLARQTLSFDVVGE